VNPAPAARVAEAGSKAGRTQMADDPKNRGAQDRSRISLSEEHEVRYWTKTLGVTKEQLTAAVHKVGNSAEAVRRELGLS
jgi:hypothetical protein